MSGAQERDRECQIVCASLHVLSIGPTSTLQEEVYTKGEEKENCKDYKAHRELGQYTVHP